MAVSRCESVKPAATTRAGIVRRHTSRALPRTSSAESPGNSSCQSGSIGSAGAKRAPSLLRSGRNVPPPTACIWGLGFYPGTAMGVHLHRNALMSHSSFLPPCRSGRRGVGGLPLVSTAGARPRAGIEPRQRTRRAGAEPSRGCGTPHTAGADASPHPGSPHPLRSTHVETRGSGQPRPPRHHTARTTDARTGTPYGCAATASCRPLHPVTPDPCPPHAGVRHSGHHGQSARGTRVSSTGGRGLRGMGATSQG